MLNIDFTFNVLTLSFILLIAAIAGYAFRSRQIRKKQLKIVELRREMVSNHAHILELQKEYVALELQLRGQKTPVLPLKSIVIDFKEEEKKVADGAI
jgi:predicted RNase H-like nuclease (RuvC/YqgF family)